MSQGRARRLLRDSNWRTYEETLKLARDLAADGVCMAHAAKRLDYPKESLRAMEKKHGFEFMRAGQGNPKSNKKGDILADGEGFYRNATHPMDRLLHPDVLDLLRRPWL